MADPAARTNALRTYVTALERAPDDHRLREGFAEFLEAVGDLSEAAAQWERVSRVIPQHHVAYFQQGRLLAREGKFSDAERLLQKSVELRPDLSEGWLELGKVHAHQAHYPLALEDFERARSLLPQDARVYDQKGLVLSKMNRRADAIQQFREAVKLRPQYGKRTIRLVRNWPSTERSPRHERNSRR
jgi:Flp pilus assembly protein TadD